MGRRLTLILGGARSGKSRFAEQLAAEAGGEVLYIATAEAMDDEMERRIAAHRTNRPAEWRTLEAPRYVGRAIEGEPDASIVLVDCLTLLANNTFGAEAPDSRQAREQGEKTLTEEVNALLHACAASTGWWILVSNEVGLGLVPPFPLGRSYRDALGRANQRLAAAADDVLFMIAGIPLAFKGRIG